MNILILTLSFPRHEDDLPGRFVLDLVKELRGRGHKISVVCAARRDESTQEKLDPDVLRVGRILPGFLRFSADSSVLSQVSNSYLGKLRMITFFVLQVFHSVKLGRDRSIDVINSHWLLPQGLSGAIAAEILSRPHVVSIHAGGVAAAESLTFGKLMVRYIAKKSMGFTVVSRYLGRRFFSLLVEASPYQAPITRIPMGVSQQTFQRERDVMRDLGPRILFVGRLSEGKGVDRLLEAVPLLLEDFKNLQLVIVGDGPLKKSLVDRARQLDILDNVNFLGYVANNSLPIEYARSDLVVVPSVARPDHVEEGLGLVAVESSMCGRPVVVTNVGGLPEVVEHGKTGLVVEEADPQRIASAMTYLLKNTSLRRKLSRRAMIHSSGFSCPRISANFEFVLRAAAAPSSG